MDLVESNATLASELERDTSEASVTIRWLLPHHGWLERFARRRVGCDELARELVQDTWVSAVERPPSERRHARAWLRTVFLNHLRMHARRRALTVGAPPGSWPPAREVAPTELRVERREERRRLADRVRALPEPFRSTLLLRFCRGQEPSEIARRLRVPAGTVRWRLKAGLDRLRHQLDRRSSLER